MYMSSEIIITVKLINISIHLVTHLAVFVARHLESTVLADFQDIIQCC